MAFFVILVVAVVGGYLLKLHKRLRELEEEIDKVREQSASAAQLNEFMWRVWRLENPVTSDPKPQVEAQREPVPEVVAEEVVVPKPEPRAPAQGESTPQESLASPVFVPNLPEGPSLAERLRRMLGDQEWEMLVGGSLLNKLGAFVLVIGIALFLGYSFGHITPAGRAAMAILVSSALLVAGIQVERRGQYRVFARGLIGAGWAALYATSYAIYAIPEARIIQSPLAGSAGMVLVAAAMIAHSLRYRSQAVTAVAYFAAFAAMAVTPSSPFAVISLIPLAGSILYLAWRFEWYSMALFGLAATYLTCISRGNSGAPLAATQSLFLAYWFSFEVFDLLRVRRRVVAGGVDLLFPLNSAFFLGLSYLAWSTQAPDQLWIASAFGATLFLGDSLIRAVVRPPATFEAAEDLIARLRSGSYEGAFLISTVLTGLAVVGRVPGMWSGVGLAVEAEAIYLAGLRLKSVFLRRLGASTFALSTLRTFSREDTWSKTVVLGHSTWNWTPTSLFYAALFYVNRALRRPNAIMSWCAAVFVAAALAAEAPAGFVGTAWIVLGLALFETGLRTGAIEFRMQAWILFAAGVVATALPSLAGVQDKSLPIAIALAVFYGCALRAKWGRQVDPLERRRFALSMSGGAAFLAMFLAWRTVPPQCLALTWCVIAVAILELGVKRIPTELRIYFGPASLLAAYGVVVTNLDAFVKFPAQAVWLTYAGGCLAALAATARLTLRPPAEATDWERCLLRDTIAALGCAAALATVWLVVPEPFVTIFWISIAVGIHEAGTAARLVSFRGISLAALIAVYLRVFQFDLDNSTLTAAPAAIVGIYWIWHRTRRLPLEDEPAWIAQVQFWAAILPVLALIRHEAGAHNAPAGWVLVAVALLVVGNRLQLREARLQSYFVAGLTFAPALTVYRAPALWISGLTVAGFYAGQLAARRSQEQWSQIYFSVLGTLLLASVIFVHASGGLLTVAWGIQGLALLGCGFAMRERVLRLQGLGLFLICILKLLLYDLRNLETVYRILSFVVLGLILLSVSWIYTRFREHVRRLL